MIEQMGTEPGHAEPSVAVALEHLADALKAAQAIPRSERLWSKATIREYFGVSDTTLERAIICKIDFPEAIRVPNGPIRWKAVEVIEWADKHRRKKRA